MLKPNLACLYSVLVPYFYIERSQMIQSDQACIKAGFTFDN